MANYSGDALVAIAKGLTPYHSIIHKFGKSAAIGTAFSPVSIGNIYQTPQPAGATALRIKAGGNANDTAAGSGAQEITLQGLDETGTVVTEAVATAGASASSATATTFIRLFRAYVSASGTYATSSAGSHADDIVIENGAGGTDWATIDSTDFARSQTEIGAYSIPAGYDGYLMNTVGFTDSSKITTILFFQRTGILSAAAPYDAMRVVFEERVEGGGFEFKPEVPIKFAGPCDVGFLAKVNTSTAEVDVDFELIIVER